MIRNFEELKAMLAACPVKRRIGVVAAQDEHTLDAVTRAAKDGMVFPVLIGDSEKIKELLKEFDFPVEMAEIIPSYDVTECAQIACRLVREGKLDCIMKGKTETGPLMKVLVNRENGIRKNDTITWQENRFLYQRHSRRRKSSCGLPPTAVSVPIQMTKSTASPHKTIITLK